MPKRAQTYAKRATAHDNAAAKRLLEIMERKKTNLCVSVDVTSAAKVLDIVKQVGPFTCLIKTHVDIIEDYTVEFTQQLAKLAEEQEVMIFEDRKFADIGNTVHLQYTSGPFKISSWAHITNAHIIPGEGIITGLKKGGLTERPNDSRALLLLAEMSSAGTLAKGDYTTQCIEMAKKHPDFVIGFISMRRLTDEKDFIYLTPGVGLDVKGDALGQQYRSPQDVIKDSLSDVIIVGRGIYAPGRDPAAESKRYRDAGWQAYKDSLQ